MPLRSRLVRFGPYEADLSTGELRNRGVRVMLAPQAFRVLAALASRPGELITRDELQRILWPNETVVEFDQSINTAIKRIRNALNDSSDKPRYIETLPRRGYRFVAQVEAVSTPGAVPIASLTPPPEEAPAANREEWDNPKGLIVSHYRILDVLGRGGMGIVYRAEDISLGRQVALKFQPIEQEADPVARERFQREARSASTLNHPNVCTVYETDTGRGRTFIAMELLEGETLRDRLSRAPLTTESLIDLAIPVCDALEAAHEHGIIHLDIKPGNIFITRRGDVKVLDFGLAQTALRRRISHLGSASGDGADVTQARDNPGTAAYMSPEQARGDDLDTRSDLYSFGVVLYECATGKVPGGGAFPVKEALYAEGQDIEPLLTALVARLLERDRALRFQTAGDVGGELRRLKRDIGQRRASDPASRPPDIPVAIALANKRRRYAFASVGLAGVLLAGFIGWRLWNNKSAPAPVQLQNVPFSGLAGLEDDLAFSPDGRQAAYTWDGGSGPSHIYVKLIGGSSQLALTGGPGFAYSPTWSPDGRSLAFMRGPDVLMISALGGPERKITSVSPVGPDRGSRSVAFTPDGSNLIVSDTAPKANRVAGAPEDRPALFAVSIASSDKRRITAPSPDIYGDGDPQFSPDGKTLAFLRWERNSVSDLYLQPWPDGPLRRLTTDRHRLSGFAWAKDGRSIVFASRRGALSALWRIAVSGGSATPEPLAGAGEDVTAPAISLQGNLLAYTYQLENTNVWRMELGKAAAQRTKLIVSPRQQASTDISPDGSRIAFSSDRSGSFEIWVCDSDGSHAVQLTSLRSLSGTPHWSPDGRWIAFDSRVEGHGAVFVVSAAGGEARQLTRGKSDDIVPNWSHDGSHVYFASKQSGAMEIWQIPAAGGTPAQVTHNGGFEAKESADGRWLCYSKPAGGIWRIPAGGGDESLVLKRVTARYWTLAGDQIYFIDMISKPLPTLNVLDIGSGRIAQLTAIDNAPDWGASGLSVSPDRRWIIWSQMDDLISRIMLLENFR
jgi:Tol biopolymer transport system component/serine/threonine protein kinase